DRLDDQIEIANEIVNGFRSRDVMFLEGPTGVGKTLIAELVRRKLKAKTIYTCTTKALQNQFVKDFEYAQVLKGRVNYLTQMGMIDEMGRECKDMRLCVTAADCNYSYTTYQCSWCEGGKASCDY